MRGTETVLALVVLAAVVATLAGRFRVPAPSLLALAGIGIGLIPGGPAVALDPGAVSLVVLPPLLFAASTDLALVELRAVLRPVVVLAVGLVAASAALVAVVLHGLDAQVPLAVCFVLGAALASTDPVAVSALARELDLPPRLLALVQGESLLNDATSLVLFQVAVAVVAAGSGLSALPILGRFAQLAGGGLLVGLALAALSGQLRRRTDDAVIGTVLALLTPYAVYAAATAVGASGVTAVVVAGLVLGDRGAPTGTASTRLQIQTVYAVVVFLLESVVFAVIGLELPTLVRGLPAGDRGFLPAALAVTLVVVGARIAWVYPATYLPALLRRLRGRDPAALSWQLPAVVSWAGTRGVVPLAAALSIPVTIGSGAPFPHRDLLLVLATSCIITTLVVQGLTLGPLVRRLGVVQDPVKAGRQEALGRHEAARAALSRLDELVDVDAVSAAVEQRVRRDLTARLDRTGARLAAGASVGGGAPSDATSATYRRVRRDLLAAESARLLLLRDAGKITESVRRRVQRSLDVEESGLTPP